MRKPSFFGQTGMQKMREYILCLEGSLVSPKKNIGSGDSLSNKNELVSEPTFY
jgi:hypothetical protein